MTVRAGFEREQLVRKFYARKGAAWIGARLGLSPGAVHMYAHRLGVSRLRAAGPCECGDHAYVALTRGRCALLDAADFRLVAGRNWWCSPNGYAVNSSGGVKTIMHRLIVGATTPHVDHADRDTLNNRRANLRPCSAADNGANAVHPVGATGLRGVHVTASGKYEAKIKRHGVSHYLGSFDTPEGAARVRDAEAKRLAGPFARSSSMEDDSCVSR